MPNQVKFVIFIDISGGYRWRLMAGNGEQVAMSESYANRHNAVEGVYRVMEIADKAIVVTEEF